MIETPYENSLERYLVETQEYLEAKEKEWQEWEQLLDDLMDEDE
jgi:hypothetical protein